MIIHTNLRIYFWTVSSNSLQEALWHSSLEQWFLNKTDSDGTSAPSSTEV